MRKFDRRHFIRAGVFAAAATLLPKLAAAGETSRIKVAIVGCGRSGIRAAKYLMMDGRARIVSVSDVFEDIALKMRDAMRAESKKYPDSGGRFDVPDSRVFSGLDCYLKAASTDADLLVLATPPAFRMREFEAAISSKKHAFLEKPICVDSTQCRKMRELSRRAKELGLTAIVGLQRRYHAGYREAMKRLHDGQIGKILSAQCFWMLPNYDGMDLKTPPGFDPLELEYQLKNWAVFVWASGDHIVEQQIHNLDIMQWGLACPPKFVNGIGGRGVDLPMPEYGNRFSHFAVDFDYGDGLRMQAFCRQEPGTTHLVLERFVGTEGIMDTNLFSRQFIRGKVDWEAPRAPNCHAVMFSELLDSIERAKAINTIDEVLDSNMLAISGRLSAYSGIKFKYEWAEKRSKESLVPNDLKFGKLPVAPLAVPGKYKLV